MLKAWDPEKTSQMIRSLQFQEILNWITFLKPRSAADSIERSSNTFVNDGRLTKDAQKAWLV